MTEKKWKEKKSLGVGLKKKERKKERKERRRRKCRWWWVSLTWQHTGYGPTKSLYLRWCHWELVLSFWKHLIVVSCFHHSNSNFWILSDGNKCWKPSQTNFFFFFCETHVFWELNYENWAIWSKNPLIQTSSNTWSEWVSRLRFALKE